MTWAMACLAGIWLALLTPGAAGAASCQPQGRAVVVTVTGEVTHANRSGNTPLDRFITEQDHKFERARAFTTDELGGLVLSDLSMVLPYDGKRHVFTGPSLEAVLSAAGLKGGITIQGIDGYHVDFPAADIAALRPVLAVCMDGQALGIGDLGPAFVVFPPKANDTPDDDEFHRMVWGIYVIKPMPPG